MAPPPTKISWKGPCNAKTFGKCTCASVHVNVYNAHARACPPAHVCNTHTGTRHNPAHLMLNIIAIEETLEFVSCMAY
ncbi:hypothetical protein XELAEV_18007332mg [Xenopus laevis]|uniref:Uncharacterized protein n=1 Tax=Xenopus laevis TaxID=8355 RepID=A0A974I4X4_XENLA|nr:hypothetical protein XELAEV_18007332mg [Xenopus laevis]